MTLPTNPSHTTTSTGSSNKCRPSMLPTKLSELRFNNLNTSFVFSVPFTSSSPSEINPTVGLISLGEEDVKGTEKTKEVFKLLKRSSLNFVGNIEGRHLFEDPVEVVVCDGFVGNVILKTCESIAVAIFQWLKHELDRSKWRMAGAYLAKDAFQTIKAKTNYEEYGGSPLLGVNGIC